jgi:MutS-like protein
MYGWARLAVAFLAVASCWLIFAEKLLAIYWLLVPIAGFIVLVVVHERFRRASDKAERAAEFYRKGIERLEGTWQGRGYCGDRYLGDAHPYAHDLDVFGKGSLFELLCTGRTLAGQRTLAYWLLNPAEPDEIRQRQEAVAELRDQLDLREDLALMGENVRRGIHAGTLPKWGEAPPILQGSTARILAAAMAFGMLTATVGGFAGWFPGLVFLAALAVVGIFGGIYRTRVLHVVAAVEQPAHDLDVLAEVLHMLEQKKFHCKRLVELQKALETEGTPPSKRIKTLDRLVEMLDSRDHLVVRLIGPPLLWATQLTFAIEAWRKTTGPHLREWLTAVGKFEALCSLASYSYEHPTDPFPEFVEEGPYLEAVGVGHPLIAEAQVIRNDVQLDGERQVLLVSGSNMSGKSTLLRTLGVNAILALAGAPVRAEKLKLSRLKVGASITVTDSLQSGVSRFYAEITRIRQLMDMTNGDAALLFLMDELLHGTNSHDRKIGAEAIVRKLVEDGAIGLVTTHDLAIAHIEDELHPRVRNVHFRDHLVDGKMKFDYKLQQGIVEHSNAIELMRSVGLDV